MAAGVSIESDLPYATRAARSRDIAADMDTAANTRVPTAKYTKMGETLRHVIPGHMQCSMACGGKACKYENPSRWTEDEQAIKGLYSSWITDSLLAMARPSTEIIEKYNIIQQFHRCALKTVINLQRPGEHASCGNPLEQESSFTYRPETFMEAGIYYYNFGWKDYGVASLTTILDMVKVMSFAVQEGKMAVHCHAGLGRTGVLLACYLVFTCRMSADQAILFVRAKRPNSIQTRGQLLCVREFAQFLVPLRSVFSCAEPKASPVTLSQYLTRQRHLLHGYEARQMKNVPKIVQLVCGLLSDIAANRQVVVEEERLYIPDLAAEVEKTVSQQALQQLGQEMRGKGICCSVWRQQDVERPLKASLSNSRSLCYSDPVLHTLDARHHHSGTVKHSLSVSSLAASLCDLCPQDIISSMQGPNTHTGPPVLKKQLHKGHRSLDVSEQGNMGHCHAALPALSDRDVSELSPETRRLLVAKALAMDHPTDTDFTSKVSMWQTDLNCREGAWERLCTERDPVVLSALMWSWLEQLKGPIISRQEVHALRHNNINTQHALDSLDKGHRLTLLCILHCAAHLLPMSEQVQTTFLNQTIKVFTKIDPASEKNQSLYTTLKAILTPLLHQLCDEASEPPL